ncbi:hypothetical protein Km24235_2937 [Klebsiella michiganensis]|nr:hypothetical protein Km24235_2937 [Klebsiella michiganensis]
MLRICPGYASSAICGPVARAGAVQAGKKPQQCQVTAYSPGCGVNALPGLRVTSNLWPVARLSAAQAGKKPQQCHVTAYSPGCGVNALPGLRVTDNLRSGSPAKRSASRGIIGYSAEARAPAPRSAAGRVNEQSECVDTAGPAYPPGNAGDCCARFSASRE